jgi:hypothetical protein
VVPAFAGIARTAITDDATAAASVAARRRSLMAIQATCRAVSTGFIVDMVFLTVVVMRKYLSLTPLHIRAFGDREDGLFER